MDHKWGFAINFDYFAEQFFLIFIQFLFRLLQSIILENKGTQQNTSFVHNNQWSEWSLVKTQPEITCSKLTIETLEQGMKYVQS